MILRLLATQRRSTRMPPSGVVSSEAAARAVARALAPDMALAPERAARAARALALERARCVYTCTFHFHCCSAIAGILFCENEANLTHHLSFTLVLQPYVRSYLRCRAAPAPATVPARVVPREAPPPLVPPVPPAPVATLRNCLHSLVGVHVPYPTPTQSEAYMHMLENVPVVSALHLR